MEFNQINTLKNIAICPFRNTSVHIHANLAHNMISDLHFEHVLPSPGECIGISYQIQLDHNDLVEFPTAIQNLKGTINFLNLSLNRIETIENLTYLTDIITLDLSHNRINTIAHNAFSSMGKLQKLNLEDNLMTNISTSVANLKSLTYLNLVNNNIHTLPAGFELWPHIREFYYKSNPIVCSCTSAWLASRLLTTDMGLCEYPSELKGHSPSCLSLETCEKHKHVSISKVNKQRCLKGISIQFKDNRFLTFNFQSGIIKRTSRSHIVIELYYACEMIWNSSQLLEPQLFLPSNLSGDFICVEISDVLWYPTFRKCMAVETENDSTTGIDQRTVSNLGDTNSLHIILIATMVPVTVIIVSFIVVGIVCIRRKHKKAEEDYAVHSSQHHENQTYDSNVSIMVVYVTYY